MPETPNKWPDPLIDYIDIDKVALPGKYEERKGVSGRQVMSNNKNALPNPIETNQSLPTTPERPITLE